MNKEKQNLVANLGASTAKSYAGSYERLRKILEMKDKRKPIKKMSLDIVLAAIEKVENPSTAYSVFVIAKKIYDYTSNKEAFDKLDQEIKKRKREIQVHKNKNLTQSLPTYKEIAAAIKKEQNPLKYITSFIMFKINTRNADIALADLHAKPKENYNKERNHLILDGNKVVFIRNVYKTVKKYGQKKNIIAVKKFADAVREILGDADTKPLFARRNGQHITASSIASYLKKYIVLGLNENSIIKVVLKHADEEGSYDMLRKISANRGTSVNVLLNEYDVSNIKNPSEVISQTQDVTQNVEVE